MNRSKDLDTIAPDDPIISSPKNSDTPQKSVKKEIPKDFPKNESNRDLNQRVYDIFGHTKNPFSSSLVNPKVFTFAERDQDEEILLALRSHWINNLSWIIIAIFMAIVPVFFTYFSFLNFFPVQYRFSAVLFWYLITFISAFEKYLSWYFDLYVITNKRIVDIDFNNLLNKHFAEADLSMIQDVSSSIKGMLGTFFNFGDVLIQTASEINQINFEKVPNPQKIIILLKELRELEEHNKGGNH